MRHGEASAHSVSGDAGRELTEKGMNDARVVGHGLRQRGEVVTTIWHSPYTRAKQTAQIAGEILGVESLVEDGGLTPDSFAMDMISRVQNARDGLMIVSHLPFIPEFTTLLLDVNVQISFSTASVALILVSPTGKSSLDEFWKPTDWLE
jgi:phosphohistidine phosphatase